MRELAKSLFFFCCSDSVSKMDLVNICLFSVIERAAFLKPQVFTLNAWHLKDCFDEDGDNYDTAFDLLYDAFSSYNRLRRLTLNDQTYIAYHISEQVICKLINAPFNKPRLLPKEFNNVEYERLPQEKVNFYRNAFWGRLDENTLDPAHINFLTQKFESAVIDAIRQMNADKLVEKAIEDWQQEITRVKKSSAQPLFCQTNCRLTL